MSKVKYRASSLKAGYRSGFEDDTAQYLKERGIKFTYEQTKIPWLDIRERNYTPDFILDNGIIIETKGRFNSIDRRKHVEIKKQHPGLDIRFVFQNCRTKLYRGSKSSYEDWCKRHGFKYANKTIPNEWLKE
jgi:hypothetical protein